jgi:hypothetical protein
MLASHNDTTKLDIHWLAEEYVYDWDYLQSADQDTLEGQ